MSATIHRTNNTLMFPNKNYNKDVPFENMVKEYYLTLL